MLQTDFVASKAAGDHRLMIVLHGLGDSLEGYRWLPQAMGLPWMHYLLVNAPDPYFQGYSWYDFSGDQGPGIERSRKLLFELIDEQRRAGHRPEQIFIFGFSQGCLMSMEIAARYPHRLGGVVGISGYVHQPDKMMAELSSVALEQPILFTHGTLDPLVPCRAVQGQVVKLQAAGMKITWREFRKPHTIVDEELLVIREFVRLHSGSAGLGSP